MACEISRYHTCTNALYYSDISLFWAECYIAGREQRPCSPAYGESGPAAPEFSRTAVSSAQERIGEAQTFACSLYGAGTLQAQRRWNSQVERCVPAKYGLIHLGTTARGNVTKYCAELPTLVSGFLRMLLQLSFAAALDWMVLVITGGGSGGLSSVSDAHGSCVLGQQSKSSWTQLVEISKGSGHFSSGLDPSSLFLALQSISDLEMERNFLDLLFPALLFRSIFREPVVLLFFLSFSHLWGMILSITFSVSPVLNILQERKYKK